MPPSKNSKKSTTVRPTPIPTQEDPGSKYAPNAWMSGGVGSMEELEVPSGQLCLVRRPGVQGLIKAGVLHKMDSLSSIVNEKHIKRVKGKTEVDVQKLMKDPKSIDEILHIVDKVVCHCVVKPEIFRAPNDATLRQPGVVYTDMIDITDKMFIFNYVVGGTRDLETFRREFDQSVGGVESSESVSEDPE
jgi:hypothetical protein